MKKKIMIIVAVILVAVVAAGAWFFFLRGDGETKLKAPDAYRIGEEVTKPLDKFLGENGALVAITVVEAPAPEGGVAEDTKKGPAGKGNNRRKNWDKTGQKPVAPASAANIALDEEAAPATPAVDDGLSIKERQKAEKKARQEAEKAAKKEAKEAEKAAKKAEKNKNSSFSAKVESKGVVNPRAGERTAVLLPPKPAEPELSEEEKEAVEAAALAATYDQVIVYTYDGVSPDTLNSYAAALCGQDEGFALVNENMRPLESQQTAYTDTSVPGQLILARKAGNEAPGDRVFRIKLSWGEGQCTAEVSCPEGKLATDDSTTQDSMSYLKSLNPSQLGLPGDSMDSYRVYPQEGAVLIDGRVYRKFVIYSVDPGTKTNNFEGVYLVDGSRLYKLDRFNDTLTPLN